MKAEFQEWSKPDSCGDRDDMGVHLYSETDCERIVKRGGMLEYYDGQLLTSELTVADFFANN
jgi:hypothetical protein